MGEVVTPKKKTWTGLVVGGPLDGQAVEHTQPWLRVAQHMIGAPVVLQHALMTHPAPANDATNIVDFFYDHDRIFAMDLDGLAVEFGIWRPRGKDMITTVADMIGFYGERKTFDAAVTKRKR